MPKSTAKITIDAHSNLRPYLERMQQRFFPEPRWRFPAPAAP